MLHLCSLFLYCVPSPDALVPAHYDIFELRQDIRPLGISAVPGLIVVDIGTQVAFIDENGLTMEPRLGSNPTVQDFGPNLGTRVVYQSAEGMVDHHTGEVVLEGDFGAVVPDIDGNPGPRGVQARSKRSAFITLTQAATKSFTKRSRLSSWA